MDWSFGGVPDWILTTGVGAVVAFFIYLGRFRFGLTEVQLRTAQEREKTALEREKLLELYERRIELLEQDALRKDDRIRWLEAENTQLAHRIKRLEDETHVSGPE